jgi:hypothetical protein
MLSVTIKPIMLDAVMLSVVMLNVLALRRHLIRARLARTAFASLSFVCAWGEVIYPHCLIWPNCTFIHIVLKRIEQILSSNFDAII